MIHYEIKDGYWTGNTIESEKRLKFPITPPPDLTKNYAWCGRWVEVDSVPVKSYKQEYKRKAYDLYVNSISNITIEVDGDIYRFDLISLLLFLARYTHTNGSGFKWKAKGKKQIQHTRAKVEQIYAILDSKIQEAFDAYDTDRTNILDNNILDLSNIQSFVEEQKELKRP